MTDYLYTPNPVLLFHSTHTMVEIDLDIASPDNLADPSLYVTIRTRDGITYNTQLFYGQGISFGNVASFDLYARPFYNDTYYGGNISGKIITYTSGNVDQTIPFDTDFFVKQNSSYAPDDVGDNLDNTLGYALLQNNKSHNLIGFGGDDTIFGTVGIDRIDGGTHGSLGDTVSYSASTAAVTVAFGAAGTGGYAQNDSYQSVENLIGSAFGDALTGDAFANRLDGAGGNDTLNGGAGNDTLTGGAGDDFASYTDAAAAVTVRLAVTTAQNTGGAGTDAVRHREHHRIGLQRQSARQ